MTSLPHEFHDELAAARRETTQMREAMATRAPIEQAKGMLMYLLNCNERVAFSVLVDLSQRTHVPLREVALLVRGDLQTANSVAIAAQDSHQRVLRRGTSTHTLLQLGNR